MKILLLTSQPNWESWEEKLTACRGALGMVQNIGYIQIDLRPYYERPSIAGGKVNRAWFNTLTISARNEGYHAVVLHFSQTEAIQWGITKYGGSCINDEYVGEMWISANEHGTTRHPSGRRVNSFVRIFVHEMSHWLADRVGAEDRTHYFDYERECVALAYTGYAFKPGIIDSIIRMIRPKERLVTPLKNFEPTLVTQKFGVENSMYKSGIHNGTDFATVVGTPVLAPTDGNVTMTWRNHKDMGNACLFEFYYTGRLYTIRCLHLNQVPVKGAYRRGTPFARTGNTGNSTGPHLHLELWKGGYNVDVLQAKDTVLATLVDPFVFFTSLKTS